MSETTGSAAARENATTKSGKSSKRRSATDVSLNMDELRELAALVDEYSFTDFEFENENIRVRLSRMTAAPVSYASVAATQPPQAAAAQSARTPEASKTSEAADEELYKITSPIVGTFYRSPGPDNDPYVTEGSKVTPESVVCIVEAMKLMNEIQAETSGEVVKIYVENGQPVEYGQQLFGVKK
jgi:acetyl-CoA carboxylase biotin carboxyl carrier protein